MTYVRIVLFDLDVRVGIGSGSLINEQRVALDIRPRMVCTFMYLQQASIR